jgi:hypothetical protein
VVNTGAGRRGSRWRRAQAQCMANGAANNTPCYLCHQPINYHFTRYYPLHSRAGTAHHIIQGVRQSRGLWTWGRSGDG